MPCVDRFAVEDVRTAVADACSACAVKVLREAVLQDHVHLLVSLRPSSLLSEFIRRCKGGSAWRANQRVPGTLRWARGYFVRSVGPHELEVVKRYIETQHQRHPELVPT